MNAPKTNLPDPSMTGEDDPRVAAAMQDYLAALEQGGRPNRTQFLAQHAEIAPLLSDCLDALEFVHSAGGELRHPPPEAQPMSAGESILSAPLGDYRIVREIGRGGMGIVYEAVQMSLGRRVALKVLPFAAALDEKHLQRFKNEAHAAAHLHHTNIVPVYAVGSERGVHFYAMQLIEGKTVSALIRERRELAGLPIESPRGKSRGSRASGSQTNGSLTSGASDRSGATESWAPGAGRAAPPVQPEFASPAVAPPPSSIASSTQRSAIGMAGASTERTTSRGSSVFRTISQLGMQAALALEHAHQFGVIHRDIKPANLLVDNRGTLWITDFGLAQFQTDVNLTRTGDMVGTLRYMSPEQSMGQRVVLDHRTDIYSLGVTLYEMLTLEPAFSGTDRHELLRRIAEEEPRLPRAIDKSIPAELETIVLKAIAKAPAERYATAQEFADDLERFLEDKPITARRPNLWQRTLKWSRRHRTLVASAFAMLVVVTTGLGVSTALIANEQRKTQLALDGEKERSEEAERQRKLAKERSEEAERQRKRAEASLRQTSRGVDYSTKVVEEELADNPFFMDLRRRILEGSLGVHQEILKLSDDDPAVREEIDRARQRVQAILDEIATIQEFWELFGLLWPTTTNKQVQEELKLSDEQLKSLQVLEGRSFARARPLLFQITLGLSRAKTADELRQIAHKGREELNAKLSPEQLQRLEQIALQWNRERAFGDARVIRRLGLSTSQQESFRELGRRPGGGGMIGGWRSQRDGISIELDPGEKESIQAEMETLRERLRKLQDEWDARFEAAKLTILTADQQAKWQEMTGKPFEFERLRSEPGRATD